MHIKQSYNRVRFLQIVLVFIINTLELLLQKIKKVLQSLMVFKKFLNKSKRKPNKIWADKEINFYNRSMKSRLRDNNIELYSTHS